ncbi:hypothetical protein [Fulvivirga sp.]|jgi:hypothetical protein|uniref:hypothetical protein n=2 Tax=Fulvivirga sp. TaxID=1931237 RepID=UPI0032ED0B7B
MMKNLLILLIVIPSHLNSQEANVPFLSPDDFDFELDYNFKTKPYNVKDVAYSERELNNSTENLPYVKMKIILKNTSEDQFRYKVHTNKSDIILNRKIKGNDDFVIDMGFADDIKDRVHAHQFSVIIYNKDKDPLSKIVIEFSVNGDMFINEKLMGKI